MRPGYLLLTLALVCVGTACEADSDPVVATRVSRIEVMNLAVAQQLGVPFAGLYPETETSDIQVQDAPFKFTRSDFDDDGRLLRIEIIDQQFQDTWYLAADVGWRGDVVVEVSITDLLTTEEPRQLIRPSGL